MTGATRHDTNRRRRVGDQAIALPMEARQNDALAHAAELFVARRYALPTIDVAGSRPDHGYDFALARRGCRTTLVDVKWTPRDDGRLVVTKGKLRAHAYVLVTGATPDRFVIRGFAWSAQLREAIGDLGHGPCYALRQEALRAGVDVLFGACGYPPTQKDAAAGEGDRVVVEA